MKTNLMFFKSVLDQICTLGIGTPEPCCDKTDHVCWVGPQNQENRYSHSVQCTENRYSHSVECTEKTSNRLGKELK